MPFRFNPNYCCCCRDCSCIYVGPHNKNVIEELNNIEFCTHTNAPFFVNEYSINCTGEKEYNWSLKVAQHYSTCCSKNKFSYEKTHIPCAWITISFFRYDWYNSKKKSKTNMFLVADSKESSVTTTPICLYYPIDPRDNCIGIQETRTNNENIIQYEHLNSVFNEFKKSSYCKYNHYGQISNYYDYNVNDFDIVVCFCVSTDGRMNRVLNYLYQICIKTRQQVYAQTVYNDIWIQGLVPYLSRYASDASDVFSMRAADGNIIRCF